MVDLQSKSVLQGESTLPDTDDDIHVVFESLAENNINMPALFFSDREMTFGQLNQAANEFARKFLSELKRLSVLDKRPCRPVVSILMPPSFDRIVTILALWKLGSAYLPLEPFTPVSRIKHIVREAKPLAVIISDDLFHYLNRTDVLVENTRLFSFEGIQKIAGTVSNGNLSDEEIVASGQSKARLAVVLYTSGSTGVPKGVLLTHKSILNRLQWQWRVVPFQKEDVGAAKTSISFVDSVNEIWGCLLKGVPLAIIPKAEVQNPEMFIATLEKHQVSRIVLVPSQLHSMLLCLRMMNEPSKLSKLTYVVCASEILTTDLAEDFFRYFKTGHTLANYYGMTETTGDVTSETFTCIEDVKNKQYNGKLSVGHVMDNCVAFVVDENMCLVDQGQLGELVVCGKNIAEGYMNASHMANYFLVNTLGDPNAAQYMLRTGDYVRMYDGRIYYEGRKDSQVKIRGQRVNISEIAELMRRHQDLGNVVVLFYNEKDQDPKIIAFYTVLSGQSVTERELLKFCTESLPTYMIPTLYKVDEIPLHPGTGKIDGQRLKEIYAESLIDDIFEGEDLDDRTKTVIEIIAHSLGVQRSHVDTQRNFFDIGGNSINAVLTLAKMKERGIEMSVSEFLDSKTVQEIIDGSGRTEATLVSGEITDETAKPSWNQKYEIVIIDSDFPDKAAAVHLLTTGFIHKEVTIKSTGVTLAEMEALVEDAFPSCAESGTSLAVYEKSSRKLVGCSFCSDIKSLPPPEELFEGENMRKIGEVLAVTEKATAERRAEGKWLEILMNCTDLSVQPDMNLEIIELIERKTIELAKKEGFTGIFTDNTSHVTAKIDNFLGYETVIRLKLREIKDHNGDILMPNAPDDAFVDSMICVL